MRRKGNSVSSAYSNHTHTKELYKYMHQKIIMHGWFKIEFQQKDSGSQGEKNKAKTKQKVKMTFLSPKYQ